MGIQHQGWGSKVVSILGTEFVEQDRADSVGMYIWSFVACLGSAGMPFMSRFHVLTAHSVCYFHGGGSTVIWFSIHGSHEAL